MIRLLLPEQEFSLGELLQIDNQNFHYLTSVMRCNINDEIEAFNGNSPSFICSIFKIEKKQLTLKVIRKSQEYCRSSKITIAFAINKKNEIIAEKATELGVTKFQPLITEHVSFHKFNSIRFNAHIKESLEQSNRNDLPKLEELKELQKWLAKIDFSNKILFFCSEKGGLRIANIFNQFYSDSIARQKIKQDSIKDVDEIIILIGPEGGFSNAESDFILQHSNLISQQFGQKIYQASLGKQILRVETAVIASIAIINEFYYHQISDDINY